MSCVRAGIGLGTIEGISGVNTCPGGKEIAEAVLECHQLYLVSIKFPALFICCKSKTLIIDIEFFQDP